MARMRRLLPALLLPFLAACDPASLGVTAAVGVGSVAVIGRTPVDAAVSLATGRDCSIVRLDRGQSYCRPVEPPPAPPPYCTRGLGRVDCWREPPLAIPLQRGVADGPTALTPEQEAHRTRRWGFW